MLLVLLGVIKQCSFCFAEKPDNRKETKKFDQKKPLQKPKQTVPARKQSDKSVANKTEKDATTVESEIDTSMNEWIKAGVQDPILMALKESEFYKPTLIQVIIIIIIITL